MFTGRHLLWIPRLLTALVKSCARVLINRLISCCFATTAAVEYVNLTYSMH